MKRIAVFCLFILALLSTGGCDFLRVVAGRPTSKEIQARRISIVVQEAEEREGLTREKFVRDSLAAVEKSRLDSAAAEAFFKETRVSRIRSGSLPGLRREDMANRYCIILASLSQSQNADRFYASLAEAGYKPVKLGYVRGSHSLVGIDPTDDIAALRASYERVRTEKFCPRDAWILVNE